MSQFPKYVLAIWVTILAVLNLLGNYMNTEYSDTQGQTLPN